MTVDSQNVVWYTAEALAVLMYTAVAVVLVRTYLRTRDVGFVRLGVAVIAWPPYVLPT
jgi:hypothetical protein